MRHFLCACALAASAAPVYAQQPESPRPVPIAVPSADSLAAAPRPECTAPPDTAPPGWTARRGQRATRPDSLCLTRGQAIAQALRYNPQLDVSAALTEQARARKVEGTAIPDPDFGVSFEQARGVFGGGDPTARAVGASLSLPFPDKFRLRGRIGSADVHAAESDAVLTRQLLASQTSQTYDSLLSALRREHDLHEALGLAQDFARKTEARFNAGSVPKLDVVRARLDIAQSENALIANERDIANARAALNRLIGRPLGAPVAAADSLSVPPPLPDLALIEPAALGARPELASLAAQQAGAHAAVSLAREYWLPDIVFGISRDYAAPGPGIITTGIALPLPIFFWQHSNGEIREARYRERELAATLVDLRAQVGQDVRAAYATAAAALRQALYIRDQLLPTAREAYRIASVSYGLGGSSALEVLDARRSLLDAESQYTDALAAANSARADLERATAVPLATLATGDSHAR